LLRKVIKNKTKLNIGTINRRPFHYYTIMNLCITIQILII